jgi:DNA-binding ferritin-like protein
MPAISSASDQRWSVAGLLEMIHETQEAVVRRLRELGFSDSNGALGVDACSSAAKSNQISLTVKDLVDACRACGQAIGAAFREARARADAASARILYSALRELEKQLWILDPRQAF